MRMYLREHLERLNLNRPIIPKKLEFTGFFGIFLIC